MAPASAFWIGSACSSNAWRASRHACTVNAIPDEEARHLSEDDEASLAIAIGSGRQFAERIRIERQRRGWSQAELARRMRDAGQPLDQAAISKIESPPDSDRLRRIDIDEAISFAKVFDLSLEEMTVPEAEAQEREVLYLLARAEELSERVKWSQAAFDHAVLAVALAMTIYPRVDALVRSRMQELTFPGRGSRFYREVLETAANPQAGIRDTKPAGIPVEEDIHGLIGSVDRILWRVDSSGSPRADDGS